MRFYLLALALVSMAITGYWLAYHVAPAKKQTAVSVIAPDPRIAELEARVDHLENWAVKQGGRFK
jgi:hypothetical protein